MQEIENEIQDYALTDFISVSETEKGIFVIRKNSDNVAIKVTMNKVIAINFVRGFGEGILFLKG